MKKRLIVDMDGVIADIYSQFIEYEFEELKVRQELNNLKGKSEEQAFINHDKYINSENFFLNAKPINGSIEALMKLNAKYDLFIVSSATQFPLSLLEKTKWLQKYFPFIHWKQIVFCGSKELINGDIMIDDHFKNLDVFKGQTILFEQPHNSRKQNANHIRVFSWREIEEIL
jgi:5'-nucleotidase